MGEGRGRAGCVHSGAEMAPLRRGWGATAAYQAWRLRPANYAAQGSHAGLPELPKEVAWKTS